MSPLAAVLSLYWRPPVSRGLLAMYGIGWAVLCAAVYAEADDLPTLTVSIGALTLGPAFVIGAVLGEQRAWLAQLLLPVAGRAHVQAALIATAVLQLAPATIVFALAGAHPLAALVAAAACGCAALAIGLRWRRSPMTELVTLMAIAVLVIALGGGQGIDALLHSADRPGPVIAGGVALLAGAALWLAASLARRPVAAQEPPEASEGMLSAQPMAGVPRGSLLVTAWRLRRAWTRPGVMIAAFVSALLVTSIVDGFAAPGEQALARASLLLVALGILGLPSDGEGEAVRADRVRPVGGARFADLVLVAGLVHIATIWVALVVGACLVAAALNATSVTAAPGVGEIATMAAAALVAIPLVAAQRLFWLRARRGTVGALAAIMAAFVPTTSLVALVPLSAQPWFPGWGPAAAAVAAIGIAWCRLERRRWRDGDLA